MKKTRKKPGQPASSQKAIAYLKQNRLAEAGALLTELCRADAGNEEAHYLLGVVNGRLGHYKNAIACFRQALAGHPDSARCHYGLGCALNSLGQPAEAINSFRKAITIKADFVEALLELGNMLYHQGQFTKATQSYRQVLRRQPDLVSARHRLGNLCYVQGEHEEAVKHLLQASQGNPGDARLQNDLGRALSSLGRMQEALACHDRALQILPGNADAIAGKALVHEWQGDLQQAHDLLAPHIERGEENVGIALAYTRVCQHFDTCPKAIRYMESMLARPALSPGDQQQLLFSLGKLHDALGDYDGAFSYYRRANAMKPAPYNHGQQTALMQALVNTFTPELMARLPRASISSVRPLFIVGMPRSGTSLVEQILASHPDVFGVGELPDITEMVMELAARPAPDGGYPECFNNLRQQTLDELAQAYLDHVAQLSQDAARVTDKMPHNFQHLGLISLLFPGARVIHCVRDSMDTCVSIYFQNFFSSHPYANDLKNLGQYYRLYQMLMRHWQEILDIPILEIRYEELVTDQEGVSRKLLEFCSIPWDPQCLTFYENRRFVGTTSYDQVREPLYRKSIERWRHYESYLDELKAALGVTAT